MESVTLELRPRLRSLSAYISFEKDIDASSIKVNLLDDVIKIHVENKTYDLPLPNVKLLPSSLSSLSVTKKWICFRIQTQPKSIYGKFETEVIRGEDKSNSNINKTNKIELPPKNTDCQLFCICCKNEITKSVLFERVLPLPSSDCDPQEWFCHKHSKDESFSLDPKESDLFYSTNYFILNRNIVEDKLKFRNSLIHCNRCLTIVGLPHGKNSKNIQIWNCCIEYKLLNSGNVVKGVDSPLTDFLLSIKSVAELTLGENILLQSQDDTCLHYILIRPMEAKLNIFTENEAKSDNQTVIFTAEKTNSDDQVIKLKSSFVVKVLYKYGTSTKKTKQDDSAVKYCEVALSSILAGIEELLTSSKRFPPAYRKAEDFYIGYLPL